MLSDAEVDTLARTILADAITEVASWDSTYFHNLYEYENGETAPVYAGTSPDGHGSFICEYMALDSIKTIIRQCEKMYDNLQLQMETQYVQLTRDKFNLLMRGRDESIKHMAWFTSLHLIGFFRRRVTDMIEDALSDCEFIAGVLLNGGFATAVNDLVPDSAVADMREELKDAGAKAAEKKIAWLRSHTDRLPSVLTKRGRGAPIKSEFKRQAEREQFIEDITSAYRKLKETKGGKRITKTDVARELGIGGDPKRGGQSALQVFSRKLKTLGISWDDLVASMDKDR